MILPQTGKPILIRSVEELIQQFDRASAWLNENIHKYNEDAMSAGEDEDITVLQQVCIDFLMTERNHYFCFAERLQKLVVIFRLNVTKAILLNHKELIICYSDEHLDQTYINLIFALYGKDDRSIRNTERNLRTFDYARSIHEKMKLHDIQLIDG